MLRDRLRVLCLSTVLLSVPLVGATAFTAQDPVAQEQPTAEELAEAKWVEGRVVVPPGTPPDAKIVVVAKGRRFRSKAYHATTVAEDGSFRIAFSQRTRRGRLVLEPWLGGRIEGRLTPPEGTDVDFAALAGTVVTLFQSPDPEVNAGGFPVMRRTKLSAGGAFTFEGLPVEAPNSIDLAPEGWAALGVSSLRIEAGRTFALEFTLVPEASITGCIVDGAGIGVFGAEVSARPITTGGHTIWRRAVTDADGSFAINGLPAGPLTLAVEGTGILEHEQEIDALASGEHRAGISLVVSRGGSVAGRVVWADGTPAAEAYIATSAGPEGERAWRDLGLYRAVEGLTDQEGRFSISGLGPGPYAVEAWASRRELDAGSPNERPPLVTRRARIESVAEGTRDLLLTLGVGLSVAGRVVDESGAPLSRFVVRALLVTDEPEDDLYWGFGNDAGYVVRSFSSADGSFRLDGLSAGRWGVRAEARGLAASTPTFVTVPREGDPLVLVPLRMAELRGRVVDADGAPVAGARVRVVGPERRALAKAPQGTTDAEGRFVVSGLAPEESVVWAEAPGHAPADDVTLQFAAGELREGVVLRLRKGAILSGTVHDHDGGTVANVEVSASLYFFKTFERRSIHRSVRTDEDGAFRFEDLPPGEWSVGADFTTQEMAALVAGKDGEPKKDLARLDRSRSVRLREGEEKQIELRPGEASTRSFGPGWDFPLHPDGWIRLHGRLVVADKPALGAEIVAIDSDGNEVANRWPDTSGEDGSYEVFVPTPGRYRIVVRFGGAEHQVETVVAEGEETKLDLDFPPGAIAGCAFDERGEPMADVSIHLRPTAGSVPGSYMSSWGTTRTAEDGTFRFDDLLPAAHDVFLQHRARDETGIRVRTETARRAIMVPPGKTQGDVNLVLHGTTGIQGTVVNAEGEPVPRATVVLWDDDGRTLLLGARHTADRDGRFHVRGFAPGRIHVLAAHEGDVSRELTAVVLEAAASTSLDLTIEPGTFLDVVGENSREEPTLHDFEFEDDWGFDFGYLWEAVRFQPGKDSPHSSGQVRLGPLPRGTYVFRDRFLDAEDGEVRVVVAGEPEIDVDLRYR